MLRSAATYPATVPVTVRREAMPMPRDSPRYAPQTSTVTSQGSIFYSERYSQTRAPMTISSHATIHANGMGRPKMRGSGCATSAYTGQIRATAAAMRTPRKRSLRSRYAFDVPGTKNTRPLGGVSISSRASIRMRVSVVHDRVGQATGESIAWTAEMRTGCCGIPASAAVAFFEAAWASCRIVR